MNPRLVLHLFATDWRRLRWFVLLAWLGMLLTALPVMRFKLPDYLPSSLSFTGYGEGAVSVEGAIPPEMAQHRESIFGFEKQQAEYRALGEILQRSRTLAYESPRGRVWPLFPLLPLLLAGISASLGFNGTGWAKVRPLRWQERALAGLLGLLAFIVVPQCALIAANVVAHGFSKQEALDDALRAGAVLLPLHACSLVLGRVCGSLWRWVAAVAGISVLGGLVSLLPHVAYWWNKSFFGLGWWGEYPTQIRPILATLAVMVLVTALLRGGRRPRLRVALTLLAVVLVPFVSFWMKGGSDYAPPDLGNIPRHPQADSIRAEHIPGSLNRWARYEDNKPETLDFWITHTAPPGNEKILWMLEKAGPLSYQGKTIPQKWGWFPTWRGKKIIPGGFPMDPKSVVPLPFEAPDRMRSEASLTKAQVVCQYDHFTVSGTAPKLDLDADLLGIVLRQREILRAPLQDIIDLAPAGIQGGSARIIRHGVLAPAVDISYFLGSPQKGYEAYQDKDPTKTLRCFLYLGGDRYVEGRDLHNGSRVLLSQASAIRKVVKFDNVKEEELATAKLVLVRMEVTGSVSSRVTAHGLPLPPQMDNRNRRNPQNEIGPQRDDWRYPQGRPSPDSATQDQAGHWFVQMINTHDPTAGRDLAPFVRRFPEMFTGYRTEYWGERVVSEALIDGLPEERRQELLAAFAKDPNPGVSSLLPVIMQRGWQADCRDTILRGLQVKPSDLLVEAAASYEDPTLYSLLLDAMDRLHSTRAYSALRRLPGIEGALTRTIEAGFARDRASFIDDPDSHEEVPKIVIAAAHGNREAFELLFPPSKKQHGNHYNAALNALAEIIAAPVAADAWEERMNFLRTHEAADFHYDSLTAAWFLNSPQQPSK